MGTEATVIEETPGENIGNAGVSGADRDELIAIVEKTKAESKPETPEDETEITDGAPKKTEAKPEAKLDAKEETPASKLHQELKAREKAKGILAKAEEREQAAQAAYAEAQKIVQQAKEFASQVQADYQRLARLKSDPVAVINEMGWDVNQIIEAGARGKDPEYQAKTAAERAQQEKYARLEQENRALAARLEKLEGTAKTYEQQTAQAAKVGAERELMGLIPADSVARKLWKDADILRMAYDVDQQVRAKTRKAPSLAEIAEYIQYEASERVRALGLKPQESAGRSNAGKSKANGSRALSSRDASERRGAQTSKSFDEMTPDEQRAHLIATVEEARRAG